jgi:hypothetical protein
MGLQRAVQEVTRHAAQLKRLHYALTVWLW